jgi:tetratricopeptide (TPR) repeat protein
MSQTVNISYEETLEMAANYFHNEEFEKSHKVALEIIHSQPTYLEPYRLLAHICHAQNLYEEGLTWINKALEACHEITAPTYFIQSLLLSSLKKIPEAKIALKKILDLDPRNTDAIKKYANLCLDHTNPSSCKEALPTLKVVIESFSEEDSFFPRICNYIGAAYLYQRKFTKALDYFYKALKSDIVNSENFFNVGYAHYHLTNYTKAIHYLQQGYEFVKNDPTCLTVLGKSCMELNRLSEAMAYFNESRVFFPDNPDNLLAIALLLKKLGKEEAFLHFIKKLEKQFPDNADIYNNLGIYEKEKGYINNSIVFYEKALKLSPDNACYNANSANAYRLAGELNTSQKLFEKAISLDPFNSEYQFNLSLLYLLRGMFDKGWEMYRSRFNVKQAKTIKKNISSSKKPVWNGESLKGKSLLVYFEQGIGDTIQFLRYLPWVAKQAKNVSFFCSDDLMPVVEYNAKSLMIKTIPKGIFNTHDFDFQAPLVQLPIIHNTNLSNIFASQQYLKADPSRKNKFSKYFTSKKFKIGFFWQGNPQHGEDCFRSIPIELWSSLIRDNQDIATFYSLQKGTGEEQVQFLPKNLNIPLLGPLFNDFSDTASAIDELDLVITIDSSVAHLSAALGKTTWVLLPPIPDWRWLMKRNDSPWYPTMTLFRREINSKWPSVFNNINKRLRKLKSLNDKINFY